MVRQGTIFFAFLAAFAVVCVAHAEIASKEWVEQIITNDDQVQADWNQANDEAVDYIKNKPTLGTAAAAATTDFAPASHNQASNTINAMTGYTKAQTAAAIDASTDTLNSAMGKLEKTLDGKQDALTAGTNISITNGVISAAGAAYTGSDGITLTGTNFTNSGVRSVSTGTTDGTISVNTNGTSTDVAVAGLGSAAYTASTDYATAAQGTLAGTAVQPGDLATVATSGSYNDLTNKPTIPAAANNATLTIQKNGTAIDTFTANASTDKTINITVPTTAADVGAVPTSRTVNGESLANNVTLDGADIALTGYSIAATAGAIVATDTVNQAIGKLEKGLDDKQNANTAVTHTASTAVGSANLPVYVAADGTATAISSFGTIANNDTAGAGGSLLKGKTVYTETRPTATNNTTGKGYLASASAATNLTNLDTAIKTIHPNTGEVKVPVGSETSSTYGSIWIE